MEFQRTAKDKRFGLSYMGGKAVFGDGCCSEYPLAEFFTTSSQAVVQSVI